MSKVRIVSLYLKSVAIRVIWWLFLFLCRYTAQKARNFVDDLKIFCMKDKKQELSAHVEEIFKQYVHPGLYICDLATGGGKSYTIGKLTCEYYPKHFERIIILCVQNKLIEGMNREIEKFIDQPGCLKLSEKLVIENNTEVILKAVRSGSLQELLAEMGYQIEQQRKKKVSVAVLENRLAQVEKLTKCMNALVAILQDDSENASLLEQIQAEESRLRYAVRDFFANYKKHLLITGEVKKVGVKTILSRFPSLERVYPQVNYASRKVFLMTVHKAMLGIDPILSESVSIRDFCDKKTLILFDESDQAAVAMRDVIIGQACRKSAGFNKYGKGYHGYLQYLGLLSAKDTLTERYDGTLLKESLEKAQKICQDNWKRKMGIYCLTRTSFWQIRRITAVIDVVCSLPVLPLSWRFVVERNTLGPSFAIGLVRRISYWLMLRMRKNCLGSMTW